MRQCSSRVTCAFALLFSVCTGCSHRIGEPDDSQELMRPQDVVSFERLYRQNCSACHGEGGRNGPALDLANPAYQALVDDTSLKHWITSGMPGTQMPAFGESAGGLLTVKQVDALVDGIRKSWASERQRPAAGMPPYVADLAGNAGRGAKIYETACLSCHQQRRQRVEPGSPGEARSRWVCGQRPPRWLPDPGGERL